MKATLRSIRIAPKKANLIAKMVRGKPVPEALSTLERTNKKAARLLEDLIRSAMANASHNDKQQPEEMIIKSLIVNKAQAYHRGYPIARGRQRVFRKFLSHITLQLGFPESALGENKEQEKPVPKAEAKKPAQTASQSAKKTVQKSTSTASKAKKEPETKSATATKKTDSKASSTKKDSSSSSPTSKTS
jgi:large subunit ribosomal protein L22